MFKNITPKQKVIIAIVVSVVIGLIIFFIVRAKKKKRLAQENEKSLDSKFSEGKVKEKEVQPTPAEGGKFRVVPEEDDRENQEDVMEEKEIQINRKSSIVKSSQYEQRGNQNNQQRQQPNIVQKANLNTGGRSRGGELPPMDDDLKYVKDESSFTGELF